MAGTRAWGLLARSWRGDRGAADISERGLAADDRGDMGRGLGEPGSGVLVRLAGLTIGLDIVSPQ